MPDNHIFLDVRRLLMDFGNLLDKHSIGSHERIEADRIIEELTLLLRDKEFVSHLEDEIEHQEHRQLNEDIAEEILAKSCPNGNCDV